MSRTRTGRVYSRAKSLRRLDNAYLRRNYMGPLVRRLAASLLVLLLLPAAAFAQAAITGVVRDASGGVLPGATVEAASPVLIEKVRAVLSDSTGQYRIE